MKKKVWLPTIIMFFFGVLFLMPIILLVMNAFKTHNDMIQNFLSFPHYLYTGNFTEAIERLKFWRVVGNSAYVTLGTMLVCTIISFMAGCLAAGFAVLREGVYGAFYGYALLVIAMILVHLSDRYGGTEEEEAMDRIKEVEEEEKMPV